MSLNKMLPEYLMNAYQVVPQMGAVSVVMRHSARYPIESEADIFTAGLTPEGRDLASQFGNWLKDQKEIGQIQSSPIQRCIDTGALIGSQKDNPIDVRTADVLSHPNENGEYDRMEEFMDSNSWPERVRDIASCIVPNGKHRQGLNLYVTHDTVIVLMAAFWLNMDIRAPQVWPQFLEPFFVWWQDKNLKAAFRGEVYDITARYAECFGKQLNTASSN
ncbi:MAG: hypothetical protein CVU39_16710 [Chloroflexi bacterium HGW-Chloroflexi-10]|nr:MAG: hypothetical protein CVU39_16710 [Chloroflexi bacterium HGW-Chloroflexi-10]